MFGVILICIIFLIGFADTFIECVIMIIRTKKYKDQTEATIISITESYTHYRFTKEYRYYPTYQYTVNDVTYEEKFSFADESKVDVFIGKKVILQYDKNKPYKYVPMNKDKFWLHKAIGGFLGIVSVLIVMVGYYINN